MGGPKISDYKNAKNKKKLVSCDKNKIFSELNFKIAMMPPKFKQIKKFYEKTH